MLTDCDDDHFHDQCGVVGVYGHPEASTLVYLGLHALQHRGQESAGIVSFDGERALAQRAMGLVHTAFDEETLRNLPGEIAIGHVRYSTAGASTLRNAQPIVVDTPAGPFSVAHNGNLVNAAELRRELEELGSIFRSTMDTEVIVHLFAHSRKPVVERVIDALERLRGSFSLVMLASDRLIAARDSRGWRPLALGRKTTDDGREAWIVASETCALDLIEAEYVREIEPGEVVVIDAQGVRSIKPFEPKRHAHCVFEYIYFARPDSRLYGQECYPIRQSLGARLAREHPANADVVIAIPDSGSPAAFGFSKESGIRLDIGLVRSHYTGRTFIEPTQGIRNFGVRLKLNPNRSVLAGQRVVVVDDSIVRGTTSKKIIGMIRAAGAREIHVRISSPPTQWPCYYGIDTPRREELIASSSTVEEIRDYIGADSLGYLSMEGLHACLPQGADKFCFACFDGDYPDPPADHAPTRQLALFDLRQDRER
ncbi:MAG: amidophosphoribosyltransferase [Deltaproteobacteria bacterium]|nr:amidophosphoribosyltransferase [Deltaproteobacteria bacterium]